ncbi:hypothetical protein SAMN05216532_7762 [Streptomyces sp. 2231.1]|nr:hypothetical protein SAMN05216532_7762 [Streptomyces sp. 2231.1]
MPGPQALLHGLLPWSPRRRPGVLHPDLRPWRPPGGVLSFVLFSMLTDPSGRERLIFSGLVAACVLAVALTRDLLTGDRADPAPRP